MRGVTKHLFSTKLSESKVRHGGRIFDMDHEIVVLLGKSKSCDSGVGSIVESIRLRARYTKSHEISSTETRERAIWIFWCHGVTLRAMLGMTQWTCGNVRDPHDAANSVHVLPPAFDEVTRREGTSKSNSVDARGSFASKLNVAHIYFWHRKIDIARDPTSRFGWK